MELCYEGGLVMPSSYAMMDEEEMTYVEGGGYVRLVCSEAFARDCVSASSTAFGTIIGALIGLLGGNIGSIIGGAVGGCIGWIVGGWLARGIHGKQTIYDGWIPIYNLGYQYLR